MSCDTPTLPRPTLRYVRQTGPANRLHTEALITKAATEGGLISCTDELDVMHVFLTFEHMQRHGSVAGGLTFNKHRAGCASYVVSIARLK